MPFQELINGISHCKCCSLYENGKVLPEIGEYARYILLLDHHKPDMEECMDKFWELFKKVGLSRQEFVVLYTTQCKTKTTKRMGKVHSPPPSWSHREECKPWLHSFLVELKEPKMLVMGNIAMEHIGVGFDGIIEKNATITKPKICGIVVPCVLSVSPSYLRVWGKGEAMVKKSLEVFKHL